MFAAQRTARLGFIGTAGVVLAACLGILHSPVFLKNPSAISVGILLDFLITIPALYYFCLVRTGQANLRSLLTVFLLCLAAARFLIPSEHLAFLRSARLLAIPVELGSVTLLVLGVRRALRGMPSNTASMQDPFERFEEGAAIAFANNRLMILLMAELKVLYYGLFAWRKKPLVPEGASAYTCYKKRGWGAIVGVFCFLVLVEGSVVHLLLSRWNITAAWIWTSMDVYLLLWICGDFNALRLRPLLLTDENLILRLGLRWSGTVPFAAIERIEKGDDGTHGPDYIKIAVMGKPEYMLTLREPVRFTGLLGRQKMARYLGLTVDDPELIARLRTILETQ